MYWQVYLHKTVLCVEQMLVKVIERAKYLIAKGEELDAPPALAFFLHHKVKLKDFEKDSKVLGFYSQLDDADIFAALKYWQYSADKVLRLLCSAILERRLFKIEISNKAFSYKKIKELNERVIKKYKITEEEAGYLVFSDSTSNHAYNTTENRINIMLGKKEVIDIAQASDQLNISVLSVPVTKYYVFYPKGLL
jgi:HD superfamily phosphohydrolase